ncbi:MAG: acetolactate synthase [Planctomycetes bacterium]|nr:acetolactate synthase [Planctomycetota bacterium]
MRQLSIFIENQVGQLLRLTQLFDRTDVHILALSVVYCVDCAITRMIVDEPDEAYQLLRKHGFPVSDCELVVVGLPHGKRALLEVWTALLRGEINVHYTYPLLVRPRGNAAIAVHADDNELAVKVLREAQFSVLDQEDLARGAL